MLHDLHLDVNSVFQKKKSASPPQYRSPYRRRDTHPVVPMLYLKKRYHSPLPLQSEGGGGGGNSDSVRVFHVLDWSCEKPLPLVRCERSFGVMDSPGQDGGGFGPGTHPVGDLHRRIPVLEVQTSPRSDSASTTAQKHQPIGNLSAAARNISSSFIRTTSASTWC